MNGSQLRKHFGKNPTKKREKHGPEIPQNVIENFGEILNVGKGNKRPF
jgi:hypothetical protein